MQKFASEGVKLFTAGNFPVNAITPKAVDTGKKIASGQELSDAHVDDIAHYHSSHDVCPKDCEDLLWGGPAGEVWAKGKIAQAMNTGFAEENIDLNKLLSDKDLNLGLEIYSDKLDEPVEKTDDGLIWAPIARSGMLATRPGPNGEKLDQPLVFVAGHSNNQREKIGLQDIYDAFKDGAIEYVTLPIDTVMNNEEVAAHANRTFQNTGFIKDLKFADSKKVPGEKVLVGGHDPTEPDIRGKLERGTIPSRSCGLLYDYKNTTTGKVYPIALDHVALTHKPWMGGMASYGSQEFSDSTIVPMMLSEKPFSAQISPEEKTVPTKLAQEIIKPPQQTHKEEFEGEFLADVQWGDEPSYHDVERQIERILSGFGSDSGAYPNYFLIDCTGDKALIKVDYGIGPDNDAWVAPYTKNDKGVVELSPFVNWIDVTKKWVSDTIDPKQDKEQLDKLKMSETNLSDTNLAVLTSKARKDLPKTAFVYPDEERYPIHNIAHGRNALARVAQNGSPEEQAKVRAAVYRKYPQLKKNATNMADLLKEASARRLGLSESKLQPPGGSMTLLAMSEEQMERLGLSDEAKEFQREQNKEIKKLGIQLAESKKVERETSVANKIAKYKEEKLDAFPGLLREFEVTALSDDGDIAVKLNLSENGFDTTRPETATQIAERFMNALPRKDGKVDLGEFANKLETPELDRPADKPEDVTGGDKDRQKMTGEEMMAEMVAADPTLAKDPMFLALSENGKGK
jgi:hypothetical protein